jgi:hypothetical protein
MDDLTAYTTWLRLTHNGRRRREQMTPQQQAEFDGLGVTPALLHRWRRGLREFWGEEAEERAAGRGWARHRRRVEAHRRANMPPGVPGVEYELTFRFGSYEKPFMLLDVEDAVSEALWAAVPHAYRGRIEIRVVERFGVTSEGLEGD